MPTAVRWCSRRHGAMDFHLTQPVSSRTMVVHNRNPPQDPSRNPRATPDPPGIPGCLCVLSSSLVGGSKVLWVCWLMCVFQWVVSDAWGRESMDQSTTRRLKVSSTTAQKSRFG